MARPKRKVPREGEARVLPGAVDIGIGKRNLDGKASREESKGG